MADTILSGKLTVYYLDDNRRKQIRWTGTAAKTDIQKMIEVYKASEDLMTLPTQQDDGLIFSAETPGEYTIGKIDAGEIDPWFIDMKTMEHIIGDYQNFTGCALKTSGWKRDLPGDGTGNTGIVVVPVTAASNNITTSEIGLDISHADGDAGTLLDVIVTGGATDYLWIRPDSNALADDFDSVSGNLTCNALTAPQEAAALTGEMVWGNVYTQGALQADTHVYIFQNGQKITASDQTDNDWWVDGHLDRAIPITDFTQANFPIIDLGYLTVFAKKYGSKHTSSIIRMNTTSGGNVSAGLSSGNDINNGTGYASITFTSASGNWTVGDEIEGATSGARAIITQIDNPGATQTLHYYLIGDPLTDFQTAAETINNNDDTGTGSKNGSAPAAQGPALASWFDGAAVPTYTFGSATADINDDGTDEYYAISIDLNQCSLAQMHEYNKYSERRGSLIDHDGLDGEEWIGIDYAINYVSITGTVNEGAVVTGATSGATGVVVSNPGGSNNTAMLRNSRGTFINGERIYETDGVNEFDATGLEVEVVVPVAESSMGTLAGTSFFASRGVLLTDYKAAEENSFSLIDVTGTPRVRPTTITVSASNLKHFDYVSMFRLVGSGGAVNKSEYSATGGEAIGDPTLTVDGSIAADVPGKTLGGSLVLQDVSDDNQEYVLRFSSYNATTGAVTLANIDIAAADSGTDVDTIVEAGAFASAKVGDLVLNKTQGNAVSYISEVTDANTVQINPPITGQTTGDAIEINACPIAVDTLDNVYFLILFEFREADGEASASMQYVGDFFTRLVVRNTSGAATKIKGYTAEVPITTSGGVGSATRIENTVYGVA